MAFTQYYSPSDPDPDTMQPYRLITTAGEFQGDPIVHIPGNEALVHSTSNSVTVTSKPFGRKSIVRLGPDDRLYTCSTEEISIEIYTLDGSHIRTVTVSHDPIPATRADVQEKLARYDQPPYDEAGNRSGMGQRFKQMIQSADLADTWPALDDMLVDTRGQIWLNVQTEDHSGRIWWVVDQSGQILQQYQFPENVDLHEVTGTYAYGIHRDEQGLQRIMRFPVSG
jgi:hypothetical protein